MPLPDNVIYARPPPVDELDGGDDAVHGRPGVPTRAHAWTWDTLHMTHAAAWLLLTRG